MSFEVIQPSQSHSTWDADDKKHYGHINGLVRGWSFEFVNKDGEYNYGSLNCMAEEPDDYVAFMGEDAFTMPRFNGWEPTGRVMFRGYYREHYDYNEHESYVTEVSDEEAELMYMEQNPQSEETHDWQESRTKQQKGSVYVKPHTRRGKKVKGFYRKLPNRR